MSRNYSFFVGDVALDEYYKAPYWPNIKEKVIVETLEPFPGGMIANAASVYASYDESVYFLSVLNRGEVTDILCDDLKKSGVDTRYILHDESLPDSKTIIFLTEDEHTIFLPDLAMGYIDINDDIFDAMCQAKYIYTTVAEIRRLRYKDLSAIEIIKKIRAAGAKFVYDLDVAHLDPGDEVYFKEMDILFFNELGFDVYRKDTPYEQAVANLLADGAEYVVVTLGENGARVHTKEEDIHIPGISVNVVDVTGAGDTFCSSFIHALNKSDNLYLVASFANAAASRAVTIMGPRAGATNTKEVIDFMKEKGLETGKKFQAFLE